MPETRPPQPKTIPPATTTSAPTPTPTDVDAEQRRRAIEVTTHIKKLLDAFRLYEPGHVAFEALQSGLWERLESYLDQFGELGLELAGQSISVEGKVVVKSEKRSDSITHPFFSEGIQEIVHTTYDVSSPRSFLIRTSRITPLLRRRSMATSLGIQIT